MRGGLARALLVFFAGSAAVVFAAFLGRAAFLAVMGERLHGGPEFSVRRVARMIHGRDEFPAAKFLFLGDSTAAMSLNARRVDEAHSLATVYGTPLDGWTSLRAYLASKPAPRCAALAYSFQWDDDHRAQFWRLYVRLGYFPLEDLRQLRENAELLGEWPAGTPPWLFAPRARLAATGFFDGPPFPMLQFSFLNWFWRREFMEDMHARLLQNRGSHLLREKGMFEGFVRSPLGQPPSARKLEAAYLRKMVEALNAKGTRVGIVLFPLGPAVSADDTERYWMAYRGLVDEALRGLEYEYLRLPAVPEEDLITWWHFTAKGATLMAGAVEYLMKGCGGR